MCRDVLMEMLGIDYLEFCVYVLQQILRTILTYPLDDKNFKRAVIKYDLHRDLRQLLFIKNE